MKNTILILGIITLITVSCGDKKKEEVATEPTTSTEQVAELTAEDGKALFTSKTCATCHQPDVKLIGPSIKDINKIYAENNASIVAFLKGEQSPIVDTDPGQVAIMKANLDSFVKDLTDAELKAIEKYMLSHQ
ncbi:MAG: c-type cytochrome [Flavobacteriaceae bacterium]|nr:c-type cytochrome [Flavobacteriaceae bacterium]